MPRRPTIKPLPEIVDGAAIETLELPPDGREEADMPERQRRDGKPTYEATQRVLAAASAEPGPQLANDRNLEKAKSFIARIGEQKQLMADAAMEIASLMKAAEEAGGNKVAIKFAMRAMKQDVSKTRAELDAMDQVREWFIRPIIEAAEAAGSEG